MHKLLLHPAGGGIVYQQNHVGVYRSKDRGDTWERIDEGLPYDFGFGLALHASDPNVCYTIPLEPEGYSFRATDGAIAVWKSKRSGKGWKRLTKGLPGKHAYASVHRQAMASDGRDPCGIYFGTGGGQVFASADEGESWGLAAEYLPPIHSVTAAVLS